MVLLPSEEKEPSPETGRAGRRVGENTGFFGKITVFSQGSILEA
jgi:hypothetical protein